MGNGSRTDKMVLSYADFIIKWRWVVLVLSIVVTGFIASGGRFIEFSNDYRLFFGKDNPQLTSFEEIQNIYTKSDNVLFVLAPADGKTFTNKTLLAIEELTEEAWKTPYSIRVDALTNFQHTEVDEDDLTVEDLTDGAGNLSAEDLQRIQNIALNEPLLKNRLIAEGAKVTGINVTLQLPEKDINEVTEVVAYSREIRDRFMEKYPDIKVYMSGMAMMSNAFAENAQGDMATLVPLMYLAIIIITWLSIRSISGTIATLVVILLSIFAGMGFAGWIGIKLTPPSSTAPTMIMTLAVADSIHVLVSMLTEMKRGRAKLEALKESIRINMQPIFLTSLSTVVGFLSMNFSDSPPFHDLGNITAVGVAAAFFFSILTLPALIAILPVKVKEKSEKVKSLGTSIFSLQRFSDFIVAHHRPVLYGSTAVVLFMAYMVTNNELNDQFVEYFDDRVEFRRDTDFLTENLTGIYLVDHSVGAGESGGISNPEYLEFLDKFEQWYAQQPNVIHVNSFSEIMKRLNKNMNQDNPEYYRIPESRELAAQYLLLYEMSLPYGLDLNNQINVDKSATRLTVTVSSVTSNELRELAASAEQWLRDNAPEYMFAYGAGPSIMFSHIAERNIKGMLIGTAIAIFVISFILIFAFRSVRFGLLSLIPNLAPGILAFGFWAIWSGQIGIALSVVSGMTLGIVVDDSIHFLSKYLRARREKGVTASEAVSYAFTSVGKALIVTTVILVIGFSVLSLSAFKLNSGMGQLTAVAIVFALLADFTLLPALLINIDRKPQLAGYTKKINESQTVASPIAAKNIDGE